MLKDKMTAVQVIRAVRNRFPEETANRILAWLQSGMTWDDVLYQLEKESKDARLS